MNTQIQVATELLNDNILQPYSARFGAVIMVCCSSPGFVTQPGVMQILPFQGRISFLARPYLKLYAPMKF